MKLQKIVWFEGMKLDPHHFQLADKFNQYNLNTRINSLNNYAWGLKEITVDEAALAGGQFGLISCSGVMPDGLIVDMPSGDPLPKTRVFDDLFSATAERLNVYLAVPILNTGGSNCQLNGDSSFDNTRYIMQNTDAADLNTGSNLRTIGMAKTNFQIKFGDESLDEYTSIKLGEVVRGSDGRYDMNKNYIPPCLNISASEELLNITREILSSLVSKSKELRTQAGIHKPELSIIQVEILLMLQSINTYIPLLNYYYSSGNIHPENLYSVLLQLTGQLSTYSNLGIRTEDLPSYDHKHLTEIFEFINKEINSILNVKKSIEKKDISIPLRKQADSLFVGQLSPAHMQAQFYIGITGSMPESKVIAEFPKNIRISAYEEIFAVHQAGIQGVAVEYTARPPAGFTVNEKTHYFRIIKEGRFWDKITVKNNIAFFITTEFKQLQMELVLLMP
jgi:type VI secretion system protein ImpJ